MMLDNFEGIENYTKAYLELLGSNRKTPVPDTWSVSTASKPLIAGRSLIANQQDEATASGPPHALRARTETRTATSHDIAPAVPEQHGHRPAKLLLWSCYVLLCSILALLALRGADIYTLLAGFIEEHPMPDLLKAAGAFISQYLH